MTAVQNGVWLVLGSISSMVVSMVVLAVSARSFGPEGLGTINYAFAFVSLFTVLGTLSMESTGVRALVSEDSPSNEGRVLGTAFLMRLVGGLVLIALTTVIGYFTSPQGSTNWMFILIMSSALACRALEVVDYWVQVHLQARMYTLLRLSGLAVVAVLKIAVAVSGGGLLLYACLYIFDALIVGLAVYLGYRKSRDPLVRWRFDRSVAGRLFKQSLPLIGAGAMSSVNNRVDVVLLGVLLPSSSAVGIYAAAVLLSELWYFIPVSVVNSLRGSVLSSNGGELINDHAMRGLVRGVTWTSVPLAIGISLFAPLIIRWVYGQEFAEATQPLMILVWAGVLTVSEVSRGVWLVGMGLQRYVLVQNVLSGFVSVLLNLVLIPKFGLMGAAYGRLIAQFVSFLALMAFSSTRPASILVLRSLAPKEAFMAAKQSCSVVSSTVRRLGSSSNR